MLRLHVLQAEFGDCLLLEYGTSANPKYILIDGGPAGTYENHLQPVLKQTFPQKGRLELVMLSHVDNDHVTGLLDLFAVLRQDHDGGKKNTISVGGLWHNAFSQTIDPKNDIHPRMKEMLAAAKSAGMSMAATEFTIEGILEGHQLRLAALALGVPLNPGFTDGVIRAETAPKEIPLNGVSLRVVGPTQKNLDNLRKTWLKWLDKHEARLKIGTQAAAVKADTSIPNLSSIMVLVEGSGKKLLLTGDGRGSDLLQGLKQAKMLDAQGRLHVDVLKMPHHGSARNITQTFLETVTADRYVISANGMYSNPDYDTLRWLVETAIAQSRKIEIIMTNPTKSSDKLLKAYDPKTCGYTLTFMPTKANEMVVEIAG
jgi:ribonuclease BN (tRNA processing enzyme)